MMKIALLATGLAVAVLAGGCTPLKPNERDCGGWTCPGEQTCGTTDGECLDANSLQSEMKVLREGRLTDYAPRVTIIDKRELQVVAGHKTMVLRFRLNPPNEPKYDYGYIRQVVVEVVSDRTVISGVDLYASLQGPPYNLPNGDFEAIDGTRSHWKVHQITLNVNPDYQIHVHPDLPPTMNLVVDIDQMPPHASFAIRLADVVTDIYLFQARRGVKRKEFRVGLSKEEKGALPWRILHN